MWRLSCPDKLLLWTVIVQQFLTFQRGLQSQPFLCKMESSIVVTFFLFGIGGSLCMQVNCAISDLYFTSSYLQVCEIFCTVYRTHSHDIIIPLRILDLNVHLTFCTVCDWAKGPEVFPNLFSLLQRGLFLRILHKKMTTFYFFQLHRKTKMVISSVPGMISRCLLQKTQQTR